MWTYIGSSWDCKAIMAWEPSGHLVYISHNRQNDRETINEVWITDKNWVACEPIIIWRNHGQLGFRFSLSRWTGWWHGMMGVFAICYNMKQQNAHNFLCLFGFFFLPPKFPSGAFVGWEAIQNEWVAWWVSWVAWWVYNLLQNEVNNAQNFVCLFVFFLPHISIVALVVWERASHERFSIKWLPVSRTYPISTKLVQP